MQGKLEKKHGTGNAPTEKGKRWHQKFPDPMVLIFYILIIAGFLT